MYVTELFKINKLQKNYATLLQGQSGELLIMIGVLSVRTKRTPFVTILNKIAIQCKGPDGKRTRTPWAYQESPPNCPFHTSLLMETGF